MRRALAFLLLLAFADIGTGTLRYLHLSEHAAEHAQGLINAGLLTASAPHNDDDHDESTCSICSVLHMPLTAASAVPLLILIGLFVAFLSLLDAPLIPRLLVARIDCRGPPLA